MFKMEVDVRELTKAAKNLRGMKPAVEKATVSSLNWVGRRSFTQVKRALAKTTGIAFGKLEGSSRGLRFAPAGPGRLRADIIAKSDWTPLGYFSPTQLKGGVRAGGWQGRTFYKGAFIVTFASGHVGVFKREDTGGKRVTKTRISPRTGRPVKYTSQTGGIEELWGPSIQREMQREPVPQLWEDTISGLWPARFGHELQRTLTIAGKKTIRS